MGDEKFQHERHKPLIPLEREREMVVVCAPMRSNVNFSRIVRMAGCSGIKQVIGTGNAKLDPEISRIDGTHLDIQIHRSLLPVLKKLKQSGYPLIGLEQTSNSQNILEFAFPRKCALVIGNERDGLLPDALACLDLVVEIPVYGMPYSFNAATAATIAMYEYCRQFPRG